MRIILLGAPGTGKGTQAKFIMKRYNIPHISSGDMLRSLVQTKSMLNEYKDAQETMGDGKLVADDLILKLIEKRISQEDCLGGFILDGFPRTISQAIAIKVIGIAIDYVLDFDLPDELIIQRVVGRRMHVRSGRIYHIKFNPPKVYNRDDITNEELKIRKDDQEDVIRKRLLQYRQVTLPLTDFYKKEAQIGSTKYFKINNTKTITEVNQELEKIFN